MRLSSLPKIHLQYLNLEECREVVNMLATRAAHLEGVAFGLEDVSAAMADAIAENEAEVCHCGKCDECKSAYSDRMYDRKRDSE